MGANAEVKTPAECHAAMTWAQRLKRVFNIDIEVCGRCGGAPQLFLYRLSAVPRHPLDILSTPPFIVPILHPTGTHVNALSRRQPFE